ncbi:EamA-like transporter family protein [Kribbella sp. VKM Ac-2527]|uniref:EamA-like transporter family protein n=1 Tax=Kribbella caucasensis TaxID=2512215 RepID=A0A4V3C963_9ACTN|nr:DMT family transporter [Kribbella sp. VKM Ac-2527]TDO44208.1 EamA-like transporter family protein [Kribbella sp. VKM Ac-2527]
MLASPSHRHVLLLVAAPACWGVGTVLSKQVLDRGVAPLTLLAVELASSALLLLFATLLFGVRLNSSPAMVKLAVLGFLNPGLAYALGLLGLVSITASMSVLLWATEPILIMLLAFFVLGERIALATAMAVAAAMVGVLLVVYRPGASGDAIGVALTVAAVAACAFYAVLTRRLLLDDSSVAVVLVQQVAALCFAVVVAGIASAIGAADLGLPEDLATWALAAASGMVYYGFAFWLFVGGLRGVPASVAGTFLPLIPVFGLAAGYLLGDRLINRQWVGAVLVILAAAAAAIRHLSRPSGFR